jgi:hypothetical protein
MGNAPRDLVEGGEHGDRVLDRLGQSEARRSAGDRQANRKEHNCGGAWSGNLFNSSHHSAHLVNGQFSFRSGALLAWSLIGVRIPSPFASCPSRKRLVHLLGIDVANEARPSRGALGKKAQPDVVCRPNPLFVAEGGLEQVDDFSQHIGPLRLRELVEE